MVYNRENVIYIKLLFFQLIASSIIYLLFVVRLAECHCAKFSEA